MKTGYRPRPRIFLVMFLALAALLFAAITVGMTAPALFSGADAAAKLALT